jgi:predicted RecA/RadA family phage recombinase
MKTGVQAGKVVTLAAPYAVAPGDGMLVGAMFGVASSSAALGAEVEVLTEGVVRLTAPSTVTGALGAEVYWDTANRRATTVSPGNALIGYLTAPKANGETTALVRLGVFGSGSMLRAALDASGDMVGVVGPDTLLRTSLIPLAPASSADAFPALQPRTPELLATFGRASMLDGAPMNPQPSVIGSRVFAPVGSPRLTHSATGWGHGGMLLDSALSQYLECTDSSWNPFPADEAWTFQVVFSYPASLRSGGAADYAIVSTMQGSGDFKGLVLRLNWTGSAMNLICDLYNTSANRWRLADLVTDIAADVPHVVTVRKGSGASNPSAMQMFLDTRITANASGGWGAGGGTLGSTASGIPLRLGYRAVGSTIPFKGTIEAFAYWPEFVSNVHNIIYSHYRWLYPTNNVILSTDATSDVDDAITDIDKLAAASSRGMINLAAVVCDSADDDSPPATRAQLNYRGVRPRLGAWPGSRAVDAIGVRYTDDIRTGFPVLADVSPFAPNAASRTQFETSNVALVGTLVKMRPGSTTVFLVGYATAWSDLLDITGAAMTAAALAAGVPDPVPALIAAGATTSNVGVYLVLSRVSRLVICGGHYPDSRLVPGARLDVNINTPEYNFASDPTRWQNILNKMPVGVRVDFVSMGDAPGVLTTGAPGWDRARIAAEGYTSGIPIVRAMAANIGTLNADGERTSYDGFAIADLLWPGAVGRWQEMRDVVIENDGHNTTGTTTVQRARYLVPDASQAPAIRKALLAL